MLRSGLSYDLSSGRFNMIEGASAARIALAAPPQLPPPPASPARALVAQPDLCPSLIALCLAAARRSSRFPGVHFPGVFCACERQNVKLCVVSVVRVWC